MLKRILRITGITAESLLALIIICGMIYHELAIYGCSQLKGQLDVVWNTRPVAEVLNDPLIPDSVRQKLKLIEQIKLFAVDSLGIHPSESYTTYYDQQKRPTLWVLTASEPYQIKAYEWYFPILGSVSYKGFFDKAKGDVELKKLASAGFDTDIGKVGAWSTLGWFKDPVLSSMLSRKDGSLSNLIIHELTHGTLYVPGNVDFNENLANFIGHKGALLFLSHHYGANSRQYLEYIHGTEDSRCFKDYMLQSARRLDSLYKTFNDQMPLIEKEKRKMDCIRDIVAKVSALPLHRTAAYVEIAKEALVNKNAYFISFKQYDAQQEMFESELSQFHGNLRTYLNYLKEKYPSL